MYSSSYLIMLLIVKTAVQVANQCDAVLDGDGTDLLVLLCYHAKEGPNRIFFMPEPKKGLILRYLNVNAVKGTLGKSVATRFICVG